MINMLGYFKKDRMKLFISTVIYVLSYRLFKNKIIKTVLFISIWYQNVNVI